MSYMYNNLIIEEFNKVQAANEVKMLQYAAGGKKKKQ